MKKRPRNGFGVWARVSACLGSGAALVLIAVAGGCDNERAAKVQQRKLLNNHAKHIGLNIDCSGCHTGARDEAPAGLPSIRMCGFCHREDRAYPPTPAELAQHIKAKQEIEWVRPNRVPGHTYFSHAAHVKYGKLDCAECHGQITGQGSPGGPPIVYAPVMKSCITCHRKNDVSTDCLKCHK